MRAIFKSSLLLLVLIGVSVVLYNYWPYIFARNVKGIISDVQRVSTPVAVMTGGGSAANTRDLFSFAVGIREDSGEIVTASSEDRQWAIAKSGQCAEAKFYPYPPWQFEKSGTYFGARLTKLFECTTGQLPSQQQPNPESNTIPTPSP